MNRNANLLLVLVFLLFVANEGHAQLIGQWPTPTTRPGNPLIKARVLPGKARFWDEQLSADRTVARGTCHFPEAVDNDTNGNTSRARACDIDVLWADDDGRGSVLFADRELNSGPSRRLTHRVRTVAKRRVQDCCRAICSTVERVLRCKNRETNQHAAETRAFHNWPCPPKNNGSKQNF